MLRAIIEQGVAEEAFHVKDAAEAARFLWLLSGLFTDQQIKTLLDARPVEDKVREMAFRADFVIESLERILGAKPETITRPNLQVFELFARSVDAQRTAVGSTSESPAVPQRRGEAMPDQTQSDNARPRTSSVLWIQGALRLAVAMLSVSILLFWSAGTLYWPRAWVFVGLLLASLLANLSFMLWKAPSRAEERWKRRTDTKPFDKVFGLAYFAALVAMFVLSGFDAVRYRLTYMPTWMLYIGAALHFAGLVPVLWAILSNPHAETTVRIQTDRDHRVIFTGPYRFVRHPMYVGIIVMFSGWPLVLGSWVGLGVAGAIAVIFFVRTALEDATLRRELDGYEAFCKKTRYRLVPGVW